MDLRVLLQSKPLFLYPSPPSFSSSSRRRRSHSHSPSSPSFYCSNFLIKSASYNSNPEPRPPSPLPRRRVTSCSFQPAERNNAAAAAGLERFGYSSSSEEVKVEAKLGSNSSDSPPPSIWKQMKEIALFAGPATGLWICGPLMSLIDTMVIGQSSSLELAALGPATVFCDNLGYVFMFLSIATSNMVATSLAKKDKNLAQHQISMLLFVAFACGIGMFLFTKLLGIRVLTAFAGSENLHLLPAANTYVQIRGYAWPAVLVGMVAQSASLGMKDSWGPLKALAVASAINGIGDVLLCCVWGYGIAGAAWATMLSQVVAAVMMTWTLNNTGFKAFQLSIPSPRELLEIFEIAAPVFITMTSKVAFYSLLTYFATSMGTITVAAHQVMINVYCMCTVWGEPLSQTAQSFMPELIHGVNRSLLKGEYQAVRPYALSHKWVTIHLARMLLKSLVVIGAISGLTLGIIGTSFPWFFPHLFTSDHMVAREMHKVVLPYFIALMVTPSTHSLEGTLMASRDLRFLSLSMTGCLCFGGLLLMLLSGRGGLPACWWGLAVFQWARFSLALQRLVSPRGILNRDGSHQHGFARAKAT